MIFEVFGKYPIEVA
jgi:hypothetical protein